MKENLYDSSAILILVKNHPEKAHEFLRQEYVLDLTIFEIGNAT